MKNPVAAQNLAGASADSTLHALAFVARQLGIDTSVEQLRRSYVFDLGEPPTDTVIAIAREIGLEARSLKLKFQELARLTKSLPAILRSKQGGALVLESVQSDPAKGTIAVIRDPAAQQDALVAVDELRLAEVWEGEVILVKRRFALADDQQPFGLQWLFAQVMRERKLLLDVAVAAVINTFFVLATPFVVLIVVDRVLVNHSTSTLNVVTGAVTLIIIFETILGYLRRILTAVATTRIDGRLNLYIVEKLLKLPMDYFEHNPTGQTVSKLSRIWQVRHFLTGKLFGVFLDAVPLIGLVPAMLILDWRLSLWVFALVGIISLIVRAFMKPVARKFQRVVLAEQAKGAHLTETIYGMRTIKSLALEGRRRHEWDARVAEAAEARHEMALTANYPETLTTPFQRLIYAGTILLGSYFILANPDTINAGALLAFAMLASRLAAPLIQIARLQEDIAEAGGAISELATIMNVPSEDARTSSGLRLPIQGEISFQDVKFRYSQQASFALDGVTFKVPRGTTIGVMGRSGSGKTTLTRLLQGLHSGYEGMIKVDGMDLREIALNHLRSSIGVVPQENFLFSGTIRENISMARPNATLADIVRAAQLAGAEEFIERMPRGYETVLEEGAVNLSGGQRQRLAIARALLVDPPILVLDEATSALDAESEAIVNANLRRISQGRTVLSVSHRLSMLVELDAILVLERGKVYDIGTHEELLQRCDIYKHLWYQQNRHAEPRGQRPPVAIAQVTDA